MPPRRIRPAALALLLVIWPVAVAGQLADVVELALPRPALEFRECSTTRLAFASPDGHRHARSSVTLGYARQEPFTTRATDGATLLRELDHWLRVTVPRRCGDWRLGVAAVGRRQSVNAWSDDRIAGPRVAGRQTRLDLEAWLGWGETWRVRGRLPVLRRGDDPPRERSGWDVAWSPLPLLGVAFARTRLEVEDRFRTPVIDDFIDVGLNTRMFLDRYHVRLDPVAWLGIRATRFDGRGEPASSLSREEIDELQLTGELDGRRLEVAVEPVDGVTLAVARGHWDVVAEGGLYWGGQRYGRLNILDVTLDETDASATWRLRPDLALRAAYTDREVEAFGRGRMESWPFTSTAIDLLGVRQIAEGELEASLESLALGVDAAAGGVDVGVGWAHHTLRPRGTLETWIPGLFGIGRTDLVRRVLDVERITLDEVRVTVTAPAWGAVARVDVRQFVAAATEYRGGRPQPPADEPPGADLPEQGWWGGLFLTTSLTVPFGPAAGNTAAR